MVFFDLVSKGGVGNAQAAGGLADTSGRFQGIDNDLPFQRIQLAGQGATWMDGFRNAAPDQCRGGQVGTEQDRFNPDCRCVAQYGGPFDHILQFPNITRPAVLNQLLQCA